MVRVLTTDASGIYFAPFLPIGTYSVKAEASGFKTNSRVDIVLNVNDVRRINLIMEVGAVTETVEVTAATTAVELGTSSSATTIEGLQVRELALGTRNFAQLVSLMPGVSNQSAVDELFVGTTGASGTTATLPYSVNGLRNSANAWTVDGADNVDRGSNLTLGYFPSIDAIGQFKVERSSYTADTGRAGGAQINVVTKSGTSQFHGSAVRVLPQRRTERQHWTNNANNVNLVDRVNPATPCTAANYTDCYAKRTPVAGTISAALLAVRFLRPLQQGQEQDVLLLFGRSAAHHQLLHFQSHPALLRDAARNLYPARLHHGHHQLRHRLPVGFHARHPDPDNPLQPQCGRLHQGHL